ncbi:signal peptidase II [Streptococcus sp. 121]|uniref:signal peptidase II n=1 Tax=Streptococcus sp. 121 TaxID=2797637 RepID=UPI0018F0A1C4|nr:signal peptidase II [Streptococcus sp. 121]MBJ6746435.1 signal peptidase II [Streptococcus sp. 121]
MSRKVLLLILGFFLIVGDQLLKSWVVDHIAIGEQLTFWPGIMDLTYLQNRGAAFSMLQGQFWFFFLTTALAMGAAGYYFFKARANQWERQVGLALMMAGGIGNFIDRASQGFVVDMFQLTFIDFAVFNLADTYLTVGVAILILDLLREDVDGV